MGGGAVRWLAAAGPLAGATGVQADEGARVCVLSYESQSGFIVIEPTGGSRDGEAFYSLELERDEPVVGEDGSVSSFKMSALFGSNRPAAQMPLLLDNIWITLSFGDASAVDAPAMVYYTRDNTIPLDVAPGKLWYPQYGDRYETLQLVVSYGDLERHMDFGPDHDPAETLSWIAKKVGTGLQDDDLIASGDIPLAPIREAVGEVAEALQRWMVEHDPNAC